MRGGRALRQFHIRELLNQYGKRAGIRKTVTPHLPAPRLHAVWHVVHKYSRAANIDRAVSTHTFRHSCATHMLRADAPIRHLQEMLGHASIETTQIYTRVNITDLKAVHRRFYPREQRLDGEDDTKDD